MTGDQKNPGSRFTSAHFCGSILAILVAAIVVSLLPVRHTDTPSFATPAFQNAWIADVSAATGVLDLWGSDPLVWRVEPYTGAPNDRRVVQYFERGRMELETGSSQVTIGKLVAELTNGEIDLGDGVSMKRQPPDLPVDSGTPDDRVPTYLTLARLVGEPATDRSGAADQITDWIDRSGLIDGSTTPEVVRYGEFVQETGRNLPDVTVELFARPEFQGGRWIELLGYPLSDPFWTYYRRGDEMAPSLIQVFERRILVYTPGLESSRPFAISSSGKHYLSWRYGTELRTRDAARPDDDRETELVIGDNLEAWVFAGDVGTPIDLALSASGHLMILTSEGQILKADSLDPDASPDGFSVWAEGIHEPQGMIARGDSVLVTAAGRVWWYHERDSQGVINTVDALAGERADSDNRDEAVGKPVSNSAGEVFTRSIIDGAAQFLRGIASDDPLISLTDLIAHPGPVEFASGDLLISGRNDDDRPSVVLIPSVGRTAEPSDPVNLAAFPIGSRVAALSVAEEEIWGINALGDVLVAIQDGDDARLYALSRHNGLDSIEALELVRGLSRPTAIQVGLDGSIYVADAETRRVIRIRYTD